MIISQPTELPEFLQSATTLENAILLLAKHCSALQDEHNTEAPSDDELELISITAVLSSDDPYVTIELSDVEIDIRNGLVYVDNPISVDIFSAGNTYPWNAESSLECLVRVLFKTFELEKKPAINSDEVELMRLELTQNTNFNEPMFTLSATLNLSITISQQEQTIHYSANEYLEGIFEDY